MAKLTDLEGLSIHTKIVETRSFAAAATELKLSAATELKLSKATRVEGRHAP